jgi:uroporphyrinogen-III synthase
VTLPIFDIRPEPGCAATVARGREAGLEIVASPLFDVRPLACEPPPVERIDGLLVGSANALRLAGPALAALRGKPVLAVGAVTTAAARAAGLTVEATGSGGLQPLLASVRAPRTLLRLAGEEHVRLSPPLGVVIDTRIVYRSQRLPLPAEAAAVLGGGAVVLLHSGVAARHFAAECERLAIQRGRIALAALAPRIAAAAGNGWRAVRSIAEPREAALLALARDMCHESPPW